MRYFLVDDDDSIRAILSDIIEDEDLGTVIGEAMDGSEVYSELLAKKKIDILIIDLLMPNRDGLETIRELSHLFIGKIIMLSQVETKDLIGEAYGLGIEYYITKPVNRLEVINVLTKVKEKILLEKSIHDFQSSLRQLNNPNLLQARVAPLEEDKSEQFITACKSLLTDLGIISECGHRDILDILYVMFEQETNTLQLKHLFEQAAYKRYGCSIEDLQKEIKSSEQRVRRAIHQSLEHIASLGLQDYMNPVFEQYSSTFFDFAQVRLKMNELQAQSKDAIPHARVNIKKFIQALYLEAMKKA